MTIAPTRRRERMLEGGRSRGKRVGVKLERVGSDYNLRNDSCIKAYVRLMRHGPSGPGSCRGSVSFDHVLDAGARCT